MSRMGGGMGQTSPPGPLSNIWRGGDSRFRGNDERDNGFDECGGGSDGRSVLRPYG